MKRVLFALCFVPGVALAGIGDDFKDASNREGCEAIPYSSERSTCTSLGRDVDDWCKNSSRKWSCEDLDPSGLAKNIDNVNSKINDLKHERDDLDYKRNNAKDENERKDYARQLDEKKAQIEALQKKVEDWTKQISDEKTKAADRQAIGERCVANRVLVKDLFANVKAKVQSESDVVAKQYVSRLVDIYTKQEPGHKEAIDIANRGVEKCKGMH